MTARHASSSMSMLVRAIHHDTVDYEAVLGRAAGDHVTSGGRTAGVVARVDARELGEVVGHRCRSGRRR